MGVADIVKNLIMNFFAVFPFTEMSLNSGCIFRKVQITSSKGDLTKFEVEISLCVLVVTLLKAPNIY